MKPSYAVLASILATVAHSQTIASEVAMIPSCALTCLTTAITAAGCGLTDYACQCGSGKNAITKQATPCIASACSSSDTLKVEPITAEICVLQAAMPVSSSAVSAASSMATGASSAISSAVVSASSSVASMVSSVSMSASSIASKASASSTEASSSGTAASATSSTPATTSTAGGSRIQIAGAIVGAAALAAFAL